MENTEFQQTPIIPETPIISEPSFNPVETLPKPKNNRILIAIIVILLLAVLYLFYLNFNKPSTITSTSTPTTGVIPTETAISSPTADWKTFSNEKFSFKIPNTWDTYLITGGTSDTLMVAPKEEVDKVKNMTNSFEGGKFLTITINTSSPMPIVPKTDESQNVISEAIKIGGFDATKYSIQYLQNIPGFSQGDKTTIVIVKNNGSFIEIELVDSAYQNTFDQILSTFKFTDNTAVIPSSIITFYTAVNSYFKSNIAIVPEKQFYSSQGMIDKASWSLDISKVDKEKGLVSNVFINQFNMEIGPGGGDGGGGGTVEFINDKLDCYYSTGYNSTGGPETWNDSNHYSNILCTEK